MTALVIGFGLAAAIYSAAGFGGGSAYLALLALSAVPAQQASALALACNLIVVSRTTYVATRSRQIDWTKLALFGATSVPAAVFGAAYALKQRELEWILGLSLLLSAIALASPKRSIEPAEVRVRSRSQQLTLGLCLGALLGLISGMVGIGGGVFLSPLLHFLRWDTSRRIALLCSAFIFINSVAGLIGKHASLQSALNLSSFFWVLPVAVGVGGVLGGQLLTAKLSNRWVTRATALVVFLAALETLWRAWSRAA